MRENTPRVKKIVKYMYGTFIAGVLFLVLLFFLISAGALGFMPSFEELENPESNLATEVYAADGVLLGRFFLENRSRVEYDEISPNVINALIATEDKRFYDHSGIDGRGLMRVLVKTVLLREESSGGGSNYPAACQAALSYPGQE